MHVSAAPAKAQKRGLDLPRTGITGSYEPPDVGVGKQTWVFYKNLTCS